MGDVIRFPRARRHARASTTGTGYRSGRSSWRGTPESCSTASTRRGGTSSHWDTACSEMPRGFASPARPPTALIARSSASVRSLMPEISSIALVESQAPLHCVGKASLYHAAMTLGKRIKAARERLRPKTTQAAVGDVFGVTGQAVSNWELGSEEPDWEKLPLLRCVLRVTYGWLLTGHGPMPSPTDPQVLLEDQQTPPQVLKAAESFRKAA